jgi:hypothetical protein
MHKMSNLEQEVIRRLGDFASLRSSNNLTQRRKVSILFKIYFNWSLDMIGG